MRKNIEQNIHKNKKYVQLFLKIVQGSLFLLPETNKFTDN